MKYLFTTFLLIIIYISSCKKHHYSACFTTANAVYKVNDTIWFKNCSDFDKEITLCLWSFDDGPTSILNSTGLDSIKYVYTTTGFKHITLTIGEKENTSVVEKTIEVK